MEATITLLAMPEESASIPPQRVPGWQRHLGPLCVVLVACAIGQLATLTQNTSIIQTADTPSYLHVAAGIAHNGLIFDPIRTPGYPALLALIFAIAGKNNMVAVVAVQSALMVASSLQLYSITTRLLAHRWLASAVASMLALNLYLINWERMIGTETLSLWTVITLFGIFLRYVATGRVQWMVAFALWSVVVVLTRPFFVYLPLLLLALLFVRHLRLGIFRRSWWQFAVGVALAYGLIVGYMAGNAAICGYFGLSDVGSVNLFGKVLEYHMQGESTDPHTAALRRDLTAYLHQSHDPWGFPYHYPAYSKANYAPLDRFSHAIIVQHLPEFAVKTLPDLAQTLNAYPFNYAPFLAPAPPWVVMLLNMSYAELGMYALLPILLVWRIIAFCRDPASLPRTLSLALALAVAGTVLMAASGSYATTVGNANFGDFYRLRAPMDWAMILLLCEAALSIGAASRLRQQASPFHAHETAIADDVSAE